MTRSKLSILCPPHRADRKSFTVAQPEAIKEQTDQREAVLNAKVPVRWPQGFTRSQRPVAFKDDFYFKLGRAPQNTAGQL